MHICTFAHVFFLGKGRVVGVNVVWGKEMVKVYRGYFLAKKKRGFKFREWG